MQDFKRFCALSLVVLFAFGAVIGCGDVDTEELDEQLDQPMEPAPQEPADNGG